MITYDPRGHTWASWSALMNELFSSNQLGSLPEEQWQEWASNFLNFGVAAQSGIPDARAFNDWGEWAAALVGALTIEG